MPFFSGFLRNATRYLGRVRENMPFDPTYVVHFGNGLAVCAMGSTDMLQLRSFMIGASASGIAYNLLQPRPLWAPACWGTFFIIGHGVQIYRLLMAKQSVSLNDDEHELYERAFLPFGLTPRQFAELLRSAPARHVMLNKNELLVRQGDEMTHLSYLLRGRLALERNGEFASVVQPGKGGWCGEFWDPQWDPEAVHRWKVSYRAMEDGCVVVRWPKRQLHEHLAAHRGGDLEVVADKVQINDLWGKLRRANEHRVVAVYESLLSMSVAAGTVTREERALCEHYREQHADLLTDAQHEAALRALGWTAAEYAAGKRERRLWSRSKASARRQVTKSPTTTMTLECMKGEGGACVGGVEAAERGVEKKMGSRRNGASQTGAAARPPLKSAEPVDDSSEAVKVIVGSTFESRILQSDKDCLVEFYAPWCEYCVRLDPKYQAVAESIGDRVFIAKMDMTANELPRPFAGRVQGYPTLLFFPRNDPHKPIAYDGPREESDIKAFLLEQTDSSAQDDQDVQGSDRIYFEEM